VTVFKNLIKVYNQKRLKQQSPIGLIKKPLLNQKIIEDLHDFWYSHESFSWPNQPWYRGIGLHRHQNCTVVPFTRQLCGNTGREDYHDTLGYDVDIFPGLLDSVEICGYKAVRSKITCVSKKRKEILQSELSSLWHKDETPYEALRIIIPITSDKSYLFQLDNCSPEFLETGYVYAFDQSQYHRVFYEGDSSVDRLHLVISLSTWFTKEGKNWVPTDNFNKTHPLDVFYKSINL
jgi:hypothetical protein